jgi:hypothetical protein
VQRKAIEPQNAVRLVHAWQSARPMPCIRRTSEPAAGSVSQPFVGESSPSPITHHPSSVHPFIRSSITR